MGLVIKIRKSCVFFFPGRGNYTIYDMDSVQTDYALERNTRIICLLNYNFHHSLFFKRIISFGTAQQGTIYREDVVRVQKEYTKPALQSRKTHS